MNRKEHKHYGYWEPYAWAVRIMVEKGYGVTEAVRRVLTRGAVEVNPENIASVRVRYYAVKRREWPDNLRAAAGVKEREEVVKKITPEEVSEVAKMTPEEVEEFEV